MDKPSFVYVTYIRTSADRVWHALTDGEVTRRYWSNHRNASDWRPGSEWRHEDYDDPSIVDIVGTVVESDPPRRLVVSWADPARPDERSRVTYDVLEDNGLVRLTVTHDELEPGSPMDRGVRTGWPAVLSSLKSLLETGEPMPDVWHREGSRFRRERFADV